MRPNIVKIREDSRFFIVATRDICEVKNLHVNILFISCKGCIYIMRMETAKKNFDIDIAGNILLNSSQSPKDLQIQSGDTYAAMIVDGSPHSN